MDNNNNDNIRAPDSVKKERLIQNPFQNENENDNYENNDYMLKKAIKQSQKEFQRKEEEETLNAICNELREQEQKERQTKFTFIKTQLSKLILFDKDKVYYYEVILSAIRMYEEGIITHYKVHQTEYNNIFSTLKTIRFPINERNELTKLIIVE